MSNLKRSIGVLIALALIGFVYPVQAQEEFTLEDVVVTATKVPADVQEVPISMSVIAGTELDKRGGITDIGNIVKLAPELNLRTDTIFNTFTIRGVGSTQIDEIGEQAITVAIDGEYINRPLALRASIFDMERVEILRGPQGTLYGRNATAGAVNFIANKPTDVFDASASVDIGDYSALKVQGMMNIPLSDTFALRGAFMTSDHDGYIDGGPLVGDVQDEGTKAARLGMRFQPTDRFSWYLAGEYVNVDQTPPAQYGVRLTGLVPDGTIPKDWTTPLPDDGSYPLDKAGFEDSDQFALRTQIDYDLGPVTLSYIGGYRDVDYDGDLPLNGFVPLMFGFVNTFQYETQSHELRIHGETERLFMQGGLFYSDEDQVVRRGLYLANLPFLPEGVWPFLNYFMRDVNTNSRAVFGQGTYHLTDTVDFTAGIRYTKDEKSRIGADPIPFTYFFPDGPTSMDGPNMIPLEGVPLDDEWSETTWSVNVDWKVTPDSMLFAKISTGYKAGGFDNISAYDPEELIAYEVGSKNRFMNDRMQLNLAAFYYDYTDQQVPVFVDTTVGHNIQNAGKSEVLGLEVDVDYFLFESGLLIFKLNWTDAEYKDFPGQYNRVNADPVDGNFAGNMPPHSPEVTLTLGYDHTWNLDWGQITAGARTRYKSDYFLQAYNFAMDEQDSHTTTDASIAWLSPKAKWRVSAYVNNIEDERVIGFSGFTGGSAVSIYNWVFGAPRTYGVQVSYDY